MRLSAHVTFAVINIEKNTTIYAGKSIKVTLSTVIYFTKKSIEAKKLRHVAERSKK